jgi:hypothetical protein
MPAGLSTLPEFVSGWSDKCRTPDRTSPGGIAAGSVARQSTIGAAAGCRIGAGGPPARVVPGRNQQRDYQTRREIPAGIRNASGCPASLSLRPPIRKAQSVTQNQFNIKSESRTLVPGGDPAELCQPAFMERPVIRLPRSATRSYTDSELQTAATMLGMLRCRDDQKVLARTSVVADESEHAVDVVVDRVMRVLQ